MAGPTTHADYVLSMHMDHSKSELELKSIKAGKRTQRALLQNESFKYDNHSSSDYNTLQTDQRRSGLRSMTVKMIRRMTRRANDHDYDPDTIPVIKQSTLHKMARKDRKKSQKEEANPGRQLIHHHQHELEDENQAQYVLAERSPAAKTSKIISRARTTAIKKVLTHKGVPKLGPSDASSTPVSPPHLLDFDNKAQLQAHFSTSDASPQAWPRAGVLPVELPGVTSAAARLKASPKSIDSYNSFAYSEPPPTFRSISPSEMKPDLSSPQTQDKVERRMQCDLCYEAIKMEDYHYSCEQCDDGHRLYCEQCANSSGSCRHDLVEKQRGVRRHPTNPKWRSGGPSDYAMASLRDQAEAGVEHVSSKSPPTIVEVVEESEPCKTPATATTAPSPVEESSTSVSAAAQLLREIEIRRSEQEIKFREQAATLREQAAALHVREAQTYLLQQKLHHGHLALGTQFSPTSPVSRRPSCCLFSHCSIGGPESACQHPGDLNKTHPHCKNPLSHRDDSPCTDARLVLALQDMEADVKGVVTRAPGSDATPQRTHTGHSSTNRVSKRSQKLAQSSTRRSRQTDDHDEEDTDADEGSDAECPQDTEIDVKMCSRKYLACPFCKRDPVRYGPANDRDEDYRSCPTVKLEDIARLKQHLKRKHHLPEHHCDRCYRKFRSVVKLRDHRRQENMCDVEFESPWLDVEKQKFIHSKRPSMNDCDEWYLIFREIFPGAPLPDSPYIEASQADGFDPRMFDQFVQMFDNRLNLSMNDERQPWLETRAVREFLRSTMRETILDLLTRTLKSSGPTKGRPNAVLSTYTLPATTSGNTKQVHHTDPVPHNLPSRKRQRGEDEKLEQPNTSSPKAVKKGGNRPILKVQTSGSLIGMTYDGIIPCISDPIQQATVLARAPIASHVLEDLQRENQNTSWRTGDEARDIAQGAMKQEEPTSAQSVRSRKSVSFATPSRPASPCQRETFVAAGISSTSYAFGYRNTQAPSIWDLPQQDRHFGDDPALETGYGRVTPTDSGYGTVTRCQPGHKSSTLLPVNGLFDPSAKQVRHDMPLHGTNDMVDCTAGQQQQPPTLRMAYDQVTVTRPQSSARSFSASGLSKMQPLVSAYETRLCPRDSTGGTHTLPLCEPLAITINSHQQSMPAGSDTTTLCLNIPPDETLPWAEYINFDTN